jgi:lathosterol oxidase
MVSGLLVWIFEKANLDDKQKRKDIRWSVMSSIVFAASGALVVYLWENGKSGIYLDFSRYSLWYLPVSLMLYLFIQDTYFYWTHRLMHKYGFKYIHLAHHESKTPTAWTSFAFHPWEAMIQAAILPIMISWVPIHLGVLGIFLLVMSAFGVTNHLGKEIYPAFLEKKLSIITANHHHVHHKKLNKNYGLFFSFWDKWMGTEDQK